MPEIPSCFDRCDGLDGRPGTPAAAGQVTTSGPGSTSTVPIDERGDSPTIERAEQATITKNLTMSWDEAATRILFMGRGTTQTDSLGLKTKILSTEIQHQHGKYATMRIVSEGKNFDNPPDELEITPVALDIDIIKHPRYAFNLLPNSGDTATQKQAKQTIIRAIQAYRDAPVAPDDTTLLGFLSLSTGGGQNATLAGLALKKIVISVPNTNFNAAQKSTKPPPPEAGYTVASPPPAWASTGDANPVYFYTYYNGTGDSVIDLAIAAANEILSKIWRQQDTPYIVGFKIVWSSYFFKQRPINPGGYIENPITEANPQLPDYLWSTDDPPSTNTIFDWIAIYNPQCYSTNGQIPTAPGANYSISWLRQADDRDYQRTWYKHVRTWIGAPYGYWDTEMYNRSARPSTIGEYVLNG